MGLRVTALFPTKNNDRILLRLLLLRLTPAQINILLQNLNGAALAAGVGCIWQARSPQEAETLDRRAFLFLEREVQPFLLNFGVFIGASFIRVLVASSLIRAIGPSGVGLISACYGSSGAENPLPTQASFQSRLLWPTNREERARLSRGHFFPRNRPNAKASTYFKARTLPS